MSAAVTSSGPFPGEAKSLNAAGATFHAPLYQKWFEEYSKLTQVQVNYQAIGSGGGIKGIQDQTVDFGARWKRSPNAPCARRPCGTRSRTY